MQNCRLRSAYLGPGAWRRRWARALDEQCLRVRASEFAWRLIRLGERLPMSGAVGLCGDELLLSAGLIRTNCQDIGRAAAGQDTRPRLSMVAEEIGECRAWLELLGEVGAVPQAKLNELTNAADELAASATHVRRRPAAGTPQLRIRW